MQYVFNYDVARGDTDFFGNIISSGSPPDARKGIIIDYCAPQNGFKLNAFWIKCILNTV